MEKNETIDILNKIKINYSDLSITEQLVNDWHEVLKEYPYLEIDEKLNSYLKTDSDKPPRLNHLTNGVQTLAQKCNSINEATIWCNMCQKKMNYREYERHYGRCLQVRTIWKKLKEAGQDIPREDLEQFGDDLLEKLEDKYVEKSVNFSNIFKKI